MTFIPLPNINPRSELAVMAKSCRELEAASATGSVLVLVGVMAFMPKPSFFALCADALERQMMEPADK